MVGGVEESIGEEEGGEGVSDWDVTILRMQPFPASPTPWTSLSPTVARKTRDT